MLNPKNPLGKEKREQVRSMDINSLTVYLFRWLKENLYTDFRPDRDYCSVENLRLYLFPLDKSNDNRSNEDHFKLSEAIVNLERKQLLVRVFDHPGKKFVKDGPVICLTAIGMKSEVDDDALLLVDKPEEIVAALEQKIGELDDVVREYYLESLRAYQEGLYISSVICLGAASERAVHWLADAIEANCQNYQTQLKTKRNGIATLTKCLSEHIIPNIFNNDRILAKKLVKCLDGLATVYRENRNDAGHPKTVEQSWFREDQETLLQLFRRYITTISEAIKTCTAKD